MQINDELFNFYDADEELYRQSSLEESFLDSGIFQELAYEDEFCNDEPTCITEDADIKRILKKAQILDLPEDDTASLCLSLTGAVELLKSEIIERSLNKEERLYLQKAMPTYAQVYLIEQAIKHKRTLAYEATNTVAQNYLQNWLYKIGSRFCPAQGPKSIMRQISDDIYEEASKLEKAVCNLKIKEECERVQRPLTTAQAYLMSSLAPSFVKNIVGSNELAFNEAVKAIGIIATSKQNKIVKSLERQALIFYVVLMRICVKYACSQRDPIAYLRYRITSAFDNERRRLKKLRMRCENFCNEILHLTELKNVSEEEFKRKLRHIDLHTLPSSERRSAETLSKALHQKIHYENLKGKQRDNYLSSLNDEEREALFVVLSLKSGVSKIKSECDLSEKQSSQELKEQEESSRKIVSQAQELYEILKILRQRGWITEELALMRSLKTGAPYVVPNYGQYISGRRERENLQRRIAHILQVHK